MSLYIFNVLLNVRDKNPLYGIHTDISAYISLTHQLSYRLYPTTSRISLLLYKSEAKLRTSVSNNDIL